MTSHRFYTDRRVGPLLIALLLLLSAPASATPPAAPSRAAVPEKSQDPVPLTAMTTVALQQMLSSQVAEFAILERSARQDVQHRLHRIAYEKYRTLDGKLAEQLELLGELKRREPDLHQRIRIGRRADNLRVKVSDVRRMIELLRLYAHS